MDLYFRFTGGLRLLARNKAGRVEREFAELVSPGGTLLLEASVTGELCTQKSWFGCIMDIAPRGPH